MNQNGGGNMIPIIILAVIMCFLMSLMAYFLTDQEETEKSKRITKIIIATVIIYTLTDTIYSFLTDKDLKTLFFKLLTFAAFLTCALLGFYFRKKSQKKHNLKNKSQN